MEREREGHAERGGEGEMHIEGDRERGRHHALEVVVLMLEHARLPPLELLLDGLPSHVLGFDLDPLEPPHVSFVQA